MERTIIPKGIDEKISQVMFHIFENAFGNPIKFDTAPSASDLNPNQWGYNSTNIYLRMDDGSTIKLTGASF